MHTFHSDVKLLKWIQKEFENLSNITLSRLGFKSMEEVESAKFLRNGNSNFKYGKTRSRRSRGAGNTLSEKNINKQSRERKKCAETQSIQTRAMYRRTNFGAMKKIKLIWQSCLCVRHIFRHWTRHWECMFASCIYCRMRGPWYWSRSTRMYDIKVFVSFTRWMCLLRIKALCEK